MQASSYRVKLSTPFDGIVRREFQHGFTNYERALRFVKLSVIQTRRHRPRKRASQYVWELARARSGHSARTSFSLERLRLLGRPLARAMTLLFLLASPVIVRASLRGQ